MTLDEALAIASEEAQKAPSLPKHPHKQTNNNRI